ncbi:MAG TPA: hypothetical protein VKY74_15265 [Chloroflexia bacterium]|nr:hypothetical protein [Chloroflexia bacterium]
MSDPVYAGLESLVLFGPPYLLEVALLAVALCVAFAPLRRAPPTPRSSAFSAGYVNVTLLLGMLGLVSLADWLRDQIMHHWMSIAGWLLMPFILALFGVTVGLAGLVLEGARFWKVFAVLLISISGGLLLWTGLRAFATAQLPPPTYRVACATNTYNHDEPLLEMRRGETVQFTGCAGSFVSWGVGISNTAVLGPAPVDIPFAELHDRFSALRSGDATMTTFCNPWHGLDAGYDCTIPVHVR